MASKTELTSFIKSKALELGFCKVGIAKAEELGIERERLQEWLNKGFQGTMSWMERNIEKRTNPEYIIHGAKSVVSVAMNYYTDVQHTQSPETGKISRYAWGDDYHDVLPSRLKILLDEITSLEPTVNGRYYVDTGPVMDKVWAQRAGIGWIAKHSNVITQEYGSWVFLGELILDIELEYDAPATDHCGTCSLCIEACPTDAIVEPYVVDSNKCISYLTIEHRGEIAEELGKQFDQWVYGCDICQDVCPWNDKFSLATEMKEFYPREFSIAPSLNELANITQEDFSGKFRKSPIKRTKAEGLRRNANVCLKEK